MAQNIPAPTPYADPTYLAFLRSAGADEGMARLATQGQKDRINRQIAMSIVPFQENLQQGLGNIAGNAEANGMWSSSKRLRDQQNFETGQNRQQAAFETGLREQSADLDLQLANQIAGLRRNAGEQALTSEQRVRLAQVQGW